MKDSKKLVGSFGRWDASRVDVYVDPEDNGGSETISPADGIRRIVIGLKGLSWREILDVCVHEAIEAELMEMDVAYQPDNCIDTVRTRDRVFILHHTRFSEAVSRAAVTLVNIIPAMQKEFDKRKKAK